MTAHISADGQNRTESVAEHTKKTVYLCAQKGARCGLQQTAALCGLVHDMGKNKQAFEAYLCADPKTRQKLRGTVAHASTGAKYIYDKYHSCPDNRSKILTELITYAVCAHHGLFDCVDIDHNDLFSGKLCAVEDYEEACSNAQIAYLDEYDLQRMFEEASGEFHVVWDKIRDLFARIKTLIQSKNLPNARQLQLECRPFLFSCLQRLILSLLIDSDWEATTDFMDNVDTLSKQTNADAREIFRTANENFAAYMRKKQQTGPGQIRTEKEQAILAARNALQEECREFAKHPAGVYCLPIPTGGGKTLSSLAYALEFCRLHPDTERILYVSPFISVTEQNAAVFREAVGEDSWILEHHSSVVRNAEKEGEDGQKDNVSRYDINWEEPFICTTFVQFMNTLFSDKRASVRRMHRLVNSVVIIDEVQSMPLKCIHTFNYMINFLNTICNTTVILCTATQPALEETQHPICYSNPRYMIQNTDEWFRRFERVKSHTPGTGQNHTFETLKDELIAQTERFCSILVVLNTKSAVRKLYDLLKAQKINVVYLTTNLCAAHRSDKLKAIQSVLDERQEHIVVVSTNLIEAGVDISFECVYRSMTGLDSLAQTAGRCNRNGEREYGMVYLVDLEGENTGNMEELKQNQRVAKQIIYERDSSARTDSLLMPYWMDQYYSRVYGHAAGRMNFPIQRMGTSITALLGRGFGVKQTQNFMNQAYKSAGQEYRVIDDNSFGVIVPYQYGELLIDAIQNATDRSEIKNYIRQAQRYTVNVLESQLERFDGLIQPVSDRIPGLYMVAAPGAYNKDYGIAPEWETLIF
ncbi:MAG: CRISPR-associated helicase Cas3' [Lachnospiraceae bacterium]|nr:CRISPR-associated helicase Cas3' [Lachnospiraceae bacterium]